MSVDMVEKQTCSAEEINTPPERIREKYTYNKRGYLIVKRCLDIILAITGILVLALPLFAIAVLIKIDSEGPVIFKQERMGKDGRIFTIYKFRTMRIEAPKEMAARVFDDSEQYITCMGAFLRRTSIDELPQLYNILIGDMSLVGYRPVCLTEEHLNALRMEYGVFRVRPGITGLAQVSGRDSIGHIKKAELDAKYVNELSLKMDVYCLLKTIKTVVTGEGVL